MERMQAHTRLHVSLLIPITFRFYLTKFVPMIIFITNSFLLFRSGSHAYITHTSVWVIKNNNAIAHCGTVELEEFSAESK